MDLPAEVLLAAIFPKGPDAVRLVVAGQERVAAGRQKAHSIRKGCAYGVQHLSWLLTARVWQCQSGWRAWADPVCLAGGERHHVCFGVCSRHRQGQSPGHTGFAQAMHQPLGWAHPGQGQSVGGGGSTHLGAVAGSLEIFRAGRWPGTGWRYLFLLQYLLSHQLFLSFMAGGCSAALGHHLAAPSGVPPHTQLPRGFSDPSRPALRREKNGEKELGRAQHHSGVLLPPCPADVSPCAHLAGDVTWRLGRGENLLPAPVQRWSLSLRDVHSHRGHRFPGETTTAASPSPPSTHTLARTGFWGGGMGVLQPLYPQLPPSQKQVLAEAFPLLPGRAVPDR